MQEIQIKQAQCTPAPERSHKKTTEYHGLTEKEYHQALSFDRKDDEIMRLKGEIYMKTKQVNAAREEAQYWLKKYEAMARELRKTIERF